jgi:protein-histidine pros-kinase
MVNGGGRIEFANAEVEKLFGYAREELLGAPVEVLMPERHRARHLQRRAAFFAEPRPMAAGPELWGRRKDGLEFPVEVSLSPLETEDGLLAAAVIRDVTDQHRVEQELREANIRLEAATRAQDRFLDNMSHELRAPLNAILGFTGTLLMGLPGPLNEDQKKQLQIVQSSGRQLLSLINDLLDVARFESGKIELEVEAIDGQQLLEDVAGGLRPLADEKGIGLLVLAPGGVQVNGDRRALRQILTNLTNNAIKFTDQGEVRMELARLANAHGKAVRFSVADTGRGIRVGDQERLFAAYQGLGLYISKTLADLMGATIAFESELGAGSKFTLDLPG